MRTSIRSLSTSTFRGAAMASVLALSTLSATVARADEAGPVTGTPKGIVGGALLGAEVGTIIESLAGVHSPWVYVITDVVLGAGGAVGGYEVEQNTTDGRGPVFLLAGGLALLLPAVVLTLNAASESSDSASEDRAPQNAPPANPGAPGRSIVGPTSPSSTAPAPAGRTSSVERAPAASPVHLSLVDVNAGGLHLGVPVPEVRPTFSAADMRQYGLAQQTEVRMPLLKIAF